MSANFLSISGINSLKEVYTSLPVLSGGKIADLILPTYINAVVLTKGDGADNSPVGQGV